MTFYCDLRRHHHAAKYGIEEHARPDHLLTQALMDQLDRCADDSARRLLLGVSERFEKPIEVAPVGLSRAVAERVRERAA